ncbi:hypothetical protein AMTRI_Chr03g147240 [Amborella trichopoda]
MAVLSGTAPPLYVGDLHPDVTDDQLYEGFSSIGTVSSVRVVRDTVTGRSLGYGYVNYVATLDASKAVTEMNHAMLNGKPVRVMWSLKDPIARNSGVGNLFVKNLHESINNVGLQNIFMKFGRILSCKVATGQDGRSKGYGFVQYESEEDANNALQNLHCTIVKENEKPLFVGKFIKKSERNVPNPEAKFTNLYVKNIDQDFTEDLLREKFARFGPISNLIISKDENGNSKGFGFVNFECPDDAKRAVEALDGMDLGSKTLYVARAQKKHERQEILRRLFEERRNEQILKYQGSNLYVKNIDDNVTDEELRKHFSQCGTITSAKLMRDNRGLSKGFGFVCFSSTEEANKAVVTLHGHMFHDKPLYVAHAQRKEERQAQLQLQYSRLSEQAATVVPPPYQHLYYPSPSVMSQMAPRQGVMYQPFGLRSSSWRPNVFSPYTGQGYQPLPSPVVPNNQRHHRQNRGRSNGHFQTQNGQTASVISNMQQAAQSLAILKDTGSNQHNGQTTKYTSNGHASKYTPNGRSWEISDGQSMAPSSTAASSNGSGAQGSEMLNSLLAAATPQQQKNILGERLFPIVKKQKNDLAGKITGMLLEMDNSELLLLLESPDSLNNKIEEAVQVLKLSKAKVGSQEVLQTNYLSTEVAVS